MTDASEVFYLMDSDWGDLAYAIAIIIMGLAGAAGNLFKKKKKQAEQAEFEKEIKDRSRKPSESGKHKIEELVEVLLPPELRRKLRAEPPQRPAAPKVASPLERPRAPAPPRPVRARPARPAHRGLDALHAEAVVIDSAQHAKSVSRDADRLGRAAEQRAQKLRDRFGSRKPSARGRPARLARRGRPARLARQGRARKRRPRYSARALREAIITREILDKPVALREPPTI